MERFAIKIDERVKLNLYKICRLCGIDNREQVLILDDLVSGTVSEDEPSLSKKISDCVGIQVEVADNMPQKICCLCVDKINDFFEYREMCKATNIQTRDLLGLPPQEDIIKSILSDPDPEPFVRIPVDNVKRRRKIKAETLQKEKLEIEDSKPIVNEDSVPGLRTISTNRSIMLRKKKKKMLQRAKNVKFNPVAININSTRSAAKKILGTDPILPVETNLELSESNIPQLRRKSILPILEPTVPLIKKKAQPPEQAVPQTSKKKIIQQPEPVLFTKKKIVAMPESLIPIKKRLSVQSIEQIMPGNKKKSVISQLETTSSMKKKSTVVSIDTVPLLKRRATLQTETITIPASKRKLSQEKVLEIVPQLKKRVSFPDTIPTKNKKLSISDVEKTSISEDIKDIKPIKEDIDQTVDENNTSNENSSQLLALKTPNRRERQREIQESKKKRKEQTILQNIELPLKKAKLEPTISCIVCPKEFKFQYEYDNHFFRDHTPNTLEHGCSACREAFYDLQEFKDHQLWHRLSATPFICFKCETAFERLTSYSRHFASSCVEPPIFTIVQDIKCNICSKNFATKNLYEWHECFIKNNTRCRKCGKYFTKKNVLFKHVLLCKGKLLEKTTEISKVFKNTPAADVGIEAVIKPTATDVVVEKLRSKKKKKGSKVSTSVNLPTTQPQNVSNDGDKIVKIEPGSILEIENESHISDFESNEVGFQDDDNESIHSNQNIESTTDSTIKKDLGSINQPQNIITEDSSVTKILKQEPLDKPIEEDDDDVIIVFDSRTTVTSEQELVIKLEKSISEDEEIVKTAVNESILNNIKPEQTDDDTTQINKTPATTKPTLKLKIRKEHGTLNSSFIDSDLGEGESTTSAATTHRRHKKKNKGKKIYKFPKQLAMLIQREKQNLVEIPQPDTSSSGIRMPIISEVSSISASQLPPEVFDNQPEFYSQDEEQSEHNNFNKTDQTDSADKTNNIRIPVIKEVVSLEKSLKIPLISSVTSLSKTLTENTVIPNIHIKTEPNISPNNSFDENNETYSNMNIVRDREMGDTSEIEATATAEIFQTASSSNMKVLRKSRKQSQVCIGNKIITIKSEPEEEISTVEKDGQNGSLIIPSTSSHRLERDLFTTGGLLRVPKQEYITENEELDASLINQNTLSHEKDYDFFPTGRLLRVPKQEIITEKEGENDSLAIQNISAREKDEDFLTTGGILIIPKQEPITDLPSENETEENEKDGDFYPTGSLLRTSKDERDEGNVSSLITQTISLHEKDVVIFSADNWLRVPKQENIILSPLPDNEISTVEEENVDLNIENTTSHEEDANFFPTGTLLRIPKNEPIENEVEPSTLPNDNDDEFFPIGRLLKASKQENERENVCLTMQISSSHEKDRDISTIGGLLRIPKQENITVIPLSALQNSNILPKETQSHLSYTATPTYSSHCSENLTFPGPLESYDNVCIKTENEEDDNIGSIQSSYSSTPYEIQEPISNTHLKSIHIKKEIYWTGDHLTSHLDDIANENRTDQTRANTNTFQHKEMMSQEDAVSATVKTVTKDSSDVQMNVIQKNINEDIEIDEHTADVSDKIVKISKTVSTSTNLKNQTYPSQSIHSEISNENLVDNINTLKSNKIDYNKETVELDEQFISATMSSGIEVFSNSKFNIDNLDILCKDTTTKSSESQNDTVEVVPSNIVEENINVCTSAVTVSEHIDEKFTKISPSFIDSVDNQSNATGVIGNTEPVHEISDNPSGRTLDFCYNSETVSLQNFKEKDNCCQDKLLEMSPNNESEKHLNDIQLSLLVKPNEVGSISNPILVDCASGSFLEQHNKHENEENKPNSIDSSVENLVETEINNPYSCESIEKKTSDSESGCNEAKYCLFKPVKLFPDVLNQPKIDSSLAIANVNESIGFNQPIHTISPNPVTIGDSMVDSIIAAPLPGRSKPLVAISITKSSITISESVSMVDSSTVESISVKRSDSFSENEFEPSIHEMQVGCKNTGASIHLETGNDIREFEASEIAVQSKTNKNILSNLPTATKYESRSTLSKKDDITVMGEQKSNETIEVLGNSEGKAGKGIKLDTGAELETNLSDKNLDLLMNIKSESETQDDVNINIKRAQESDHIPTSIMQNETTPQDFALRIPAKTEISQNSSESSDEILVPQPKSIHESTDPNSYNQNFESLEANSNIETISDNILLPTAHHSNPLKAFESKSEKFHTTEGSSEHYQYENTKIPAHTEVIVAYDVTKQTTQYDLGCKDYSNRKDVEEDEFTKQQQFVQNQINIDIANSADTSNRKEILSKFQKLQNIKDLTDNQMTVDSTLKENKNEILDTQINKNLPQIPEENFLLDEGAVDISSSKCDSETSNDFSPIDSPEDQNLFEDNTSEESMNVRKMINKTDKEDMQLYNKPVSEIKIDNAKANQLVTNTLTRSHTDSLQSSNNFEISIPDNLCSLHIDDYQPPNVPEVSNNPRTSHIDDLQSEINIKNKVEKKLVLNIPSSPNTDGLQISIDPKPILQTNSELERE